MYRAHAAIDHGGSRQAKNACWPSSPRRRRWPVRWPMRRPTTGRSMRRGGRSIRRSVHGTLPHDQMGRCSSSRSASTTSCRSCAGIAGRTRPHQAVLIDLPGRRFYFFFIEIWPQEVYYLTGLLILAGDDAVPDERGRRPRLVRLSLPADGLDRSVLRGRALGRGRSPRAYARDQGSWTVELARKPPPSICSG